VCQIFWTEQQRNVYVNAKFESIISPFRRFWLENTYICTCIQINTYGHIYIWTYIHMDIYTYGHIYIWTCTYVHTCMYVHSWWHFKFILYPYYCFHKYL
jgi:hypothetical protein